MKVSSEIQALAPYVPGKPIAETEREFNLDHVYKLASNENALGPSPRALKAIQENLVNLHLYPDSSLYDLRRACAKKYQISEKFFCFGNGSDELIDQLSRIFCAPGEIALTSQGSFAAYKLRVRASRAEIIEIPMTQKYSFDLPAFTDWLQYHPQKDRARLIFIANPNNPTGSYLNQKQIDQFLKEMRAFPDVIVVLDEAYDAFVRAEDFPDSVKLLKENKNLIILKTLSKVYGLAGLRMGVMMAHPEICDLVNRMRLPFNVNSLAQVAAIAAFDDTEYIQKSQQMVWQGLDYFYQELAKLGLSFVPSQANFVFFDTGTNAESVYQNLLKEGVILRPLSAYHMPRHLRMSVGLAHENQAAIAALKKVLAFASSEDYLPTFSEEVLSMEGRELGLPLPGSTLNMQNFEALQ